MTEWANGKLVISTLEERVQQHISGFQSIFGEDKISLDPDDIDMQQISIYAEAIHDLDQLIQAALLQFDPATATGNGQSALMQLNRLRRKKGEYSVGTIRATGTSGTIIQKGSLVRHSSTKDLFATDVEATINEFGYVDISVTALEFGPKTASNGTLTEIASPEYGWQSVTNLTPAIPGRYEESDEEARIRQTKSTGTPGQSVIDALRGEIANLDGVIHSVVYENYDDVVDANGLPPHSMYAVVSGGTDQDIADTIRIKSSMGLTKVGNEEVYSVDSTGNPNLIKFSRPTPVPIYIEITLVTKSGWPSDGAQRIKDAIVEWGIINQEIGEEVIQSRLYEPINSIPGHSVQSVLIGIAVDPTLEDDISIGIDELASFDQARILVNGA